MLAAGCGNSGSLRKVWQQCTDGLVAKCHEIIGEAIFSEVAKCDACGEVVPVSPRCPWSRRILAGHSQPHLRVVFKLWCRLGAFERHKLAFVGVGVPDIALSTRLRPH